MASQYQANLLEMEEKENSMMANGAQHLSNAMPMPIRALLGKKSSLLSIQG
jgi:hypothetical protein